MTEQDVIDCYQRILKRRPDPDGLSVYTGYLNKGRSISDLENILKQSDEYQFRSKLLENPQVFKHTFQSFSLSLFDFKICLKSSANLVKLIIHLWDTLPDRIIVSNMNRCPSELQLFGQIIIKDADNFGLSKDLILSKPKIYYQMLENVKFNPYSMNLPKQTYKLVVSRYNEDLDWLENLNENNIQIYNKGDELEKNSDLMAVKNLTNVGREGETYLNHIINNYDNLDDYTVFCQADPFEHSPWFIELLNKYHQDFLDVQPLSYCWKEVSDAKENEGWLKDVNKTGIPPLECREYTNFLHFDETCKIHVEYLNKDFKCVYPLEWTDGGFNTHLIPRIQRKFKSGSVLDWIFEQIPFDQKVPEIIPFCFSALFGVHKRIILKRPKKFYEDMRKFLLLDPDHGYLLERLWLIIFSFDQ